MNAHNECSEVAYFMRRLYRQKLTTTSGGNISVRLADQRIAITPSALDKARLTGRQILLMGLDGVNHTPELKPSIESGMHLAIYQARPDVHAIVHAHPTIATAFSLSGLPINCELIAESYALLHRIALAPYALMGTMELAGQVATQARAADIVLLQNHGVVALGDTLLRAFDRLELVEAAAQMTLITRQLGDATPLHDGWKRDIDGMMGRPVP
jgi:L-fuculose-phosphate aldolase